MRLVVAILLLVSITPGAAEAIETGVHAIVHGDLAHHGDAHDRQCSEHSCTPLSHHCGCHAAMSAQPHGRQVTAIAVPDTTDVVPPHVRLVLGRATEPPTLRPPIS